MYRINKNSSRAMTLIELLIAIILVSILAGAVWMVFSAGYKVFYSQLARSGIKAEAGRAFIRMSRELRIADSVTAVQDKSITFTADINDDGVDETVQYIWSGAAGARLNRISSGVTTPLIMSVKDLKFSYYDANNNLLAPPVTASQVKLVCMDVTSVSGSESFRLRTKVALRNL